ERGFMPSIEVDLIGVNDTELARWTSYSMNQYWTPNDPLRRNSESYRMLFEQRDPSPKKLSDKDPIWQKWQQKGAWNLVCVAFVPGIKDDREGDKDPRRLILPLDKCRWDKHSSINIVVQPSAVVTTTPPKPPKD